MLDELIDLWHDAPWYGRVAIFGVLPAGVLALIIMVGWVVLGG